MSRAPPVTAKAPEPNTGTGQREESVDRTTPVGHHPSPRPPSTEDPVERGRRLGHHIRNLRVGDPSAARAIQRAVGTRLTFLRNDQYPQHPAPVPTQARAGPYTATTHLDAWLVPGQLRGGGDPVNTKFFLDVYPRNFEIPGYYHRGHVLAKSLGGPGSVSNMTPLTETTNLAMRDGPEQTVRDAMYRDRALGPGIVHYQVDIAYGGHDVANISPGERHLPNNVHIRADEHHGPAQRNQAGNLALWQATDPTRTLYDDDIGMALQDFDAAFPTRQPTRESYDTGRQRALNAVAAIDGVIAQMPPDIDSGQLTIERATVLQRATGWLRSIRLENQRDPTSFLDPMRDDLRDRVALIQEQARDLVTRPLRERMETARLQAIESHFWTNTARLGDRLIFEVAAAIGDELNSTQILNPQVLATTRAHVDLYTQAVRQKSDQIQAMLDQMDETSDDDGSDDEANL